MDNTYWNSNGTHQELLNKLEQLIPAFGTVEQPRKNRHLDKLRRALNCYHDLYNNGLFNRAAEFRRVFGIASSHYKLWGCGEYMPALYTRVEQELDQLILMAGTEQNLYKPVDVAD